MNKRTPINNERDYLSLKAAARKLTSSVGGIDGAASVTGKSRSVHGSYQAPDDPTCMPLDVVYDLETTSPKGPLITEQLAALHGMMLITAPQVLSDGRMNQQVCAVSKECCEAISKINQAINEGGEITVQEIIELGLIEEGREGVKALLEIITSFEAMIAKAEEATS